MHICLSFNEKLYPNTMMDKFLLLVLVLNGLVVSFTNEFPTYCKEVGEDCSGETGPLKTCQEDCDEYGSICKLVCLSENEAKILEWTEEWNGIGYGSGNGYKRVKRDHFKIKIRGNRLKIKYKKDGVKFKIKLKAKQMSLKR